MRVAAKRKFLAEAELFAAERESIKFREGNSSGSTHIQGIFPAAEWDFEDRISLSEEIRADAKCFIPDDESSRECECSLVDIHSFCGSF